MSTFVAVGYGPGISHATALRFGRAGQTVALIGRTPQRLAAGAGQLQAQGIKAQGYAADAADPDALRAALAQVRADNGPVKTLLWTAFGGSGIQDVLATEPGDVGNAFAVGVRGLLTCVHELLDDLRGQTGAAVLVANGAVGEATSEADHFAHLLGIDGVALENAAKSKLVGILAERLRGDGIHVAELILAGSVAGTPTATPTAIDPADLAETFWRMARDRDTTRVRVAEQGFPISE